MSRSEREQQLIFSGIQLISARLNGPLPGSGDAITLRQWLVLSCVLEHGIPGMSLIDISSYMGYSRQNLRKIVNGLERQGFVTIQPSRLDGRAISIEPTRRAKLNRAKFEECERSLYEELFDGISEKELSGAATVMAKLLRNVASMS